LLLRPCILYTPVTGDASDYGAAVFSYGGAVTDKTLTCKDCANSFEFTVRDQEFYAEKGFENEPQRCRDCRALRKNSRSAAGAAREMYDVVCAQCNVATTVPFKPRGDRPIYCRTCFASMSPANAS
jgi:CxxC-x17-CxxC domain-containing protein